MAVLLLRARDARHSLQKPDVMSKPGVAFEFCCAVIGIFGLDRDSVNAFGGITSLHRDGVGLQHT